MFELAPASPRVVDLGARVEENIPKRATFYGDRTVTQP